MMKKAIYYAAVAGDVLGTYHRWRAGLRDERQLAATYSGQFFDLCRILGRKGIASFPGCRVEIVQDPDFEIRSRPKQRRSAGLWFHLDQWRIACHLWLDIWKSGATDVIVMDGVVSFYLLAPLSMAGKNVYVSAHTVLWRKGETKTATRKLVDSLNRWFFLNHCAGCLVASPAIEKQIRTFSAHQLPVRLFYPLYDRTDFERFGAPNPDRYPFRILYVGRIEVEKGVYDLLEASRSLIARGYSVRVDFCGDGSEMEGLRQAISSFQLDHAMFVHGHLNRSSLTECLLSSHVVVVPTKSSFPEGLNQVVIEAVLAHRPVVTSDVCPALELVQGAAIEATSDDVKSYENCLQKLIQKPCLADQIILAGNSRRAQFFDPARAWTAQAKILIEQQATLAREAGRIS